MTGADPDRPVTAERPGTLGIGGWLPATDPVTPGPDDGTPPGWFTGATPEPDAWLSTPPVRAGSPDPADVSWRPVHTAPWIPPAVPSPFGEQPAHRRHRGGAHPSRPRTFLLMALAAAASVPLVLGVTESPDSLGQAEPRTTDGMRLDEPSAGPQPAVTVPAPAATTPGTAGTSPTRTPASTSSGRNVPVGGGGGNTTSSPSPSDPAPFDLYLEAEGPSATLTGRASTRELAVASGGVVATDLGNDPVSLVRFEFETPAAGSYTLTFHYVATERLRGRIILNGIPSMTLMCPPTGKDLVGTVQVRVPLRAGRNTVEFGNKNAPAPDLDRIRVTD